MDRPRARVARPLKGDSLSKVVPSATAYGGSAADSCSGRLSMLSMACNPKRNVCLMAKFEQSHKTKVYVLQTVQTALLHGERSMKLP